MNRFFKKHPSVETSKDNITFEFIYTVISSYIPNLSVTNYDFNSLKAIVPKRF